MAHVNLPTASTSAPMAGTVPLAPLQKRSSSSCRMKRMGRVGTRCFCRGKLAKTSRCRR